MTLGCKHIGIKKSKFCEKNSSFLFRFFLYSITQQRRLQLSLIFIIKREVFLNPFLKQWPIQDQAKVDVFPYLCTHPTFVLVQRLYTSPTFVPILRYISPRFVLSDLFLAPDVFSGTESPLVFLIYLLCCPRKIFIHQSFIIYQFIYGLKHLTRNNYRGMKIMMMMHRFNIKNPVLTIKPL